MNLYRQPQPRTVEEWATGAPSSLPPRRQRPLWLRITLLVLTLAVCGVVGYWLIGVALGWAIFCAVMFVAFGVGGAVFRGGRAL